MVEAELPLQDDARPFERLHAVALAGPSAPRSRLGCSSSVASTGWPRRAGPRSARGPIDVCRAPPGCATAPGLLVGDLPSAVPRRQDGRGRAPSPSAPAPACSRLQRRDASRSEPANARRCCSAARRAESCPPPAGGAAWAVPDRVRLLVLLSWYRTRTPARSPRRGAHLVVAGRVRRPERSSTSVFSADLVHWDEPTVPSGADLGDQRQVIERAPLGIERGSGVGAPPSSGRRRPRLQLRQAVRSSATFVRVAGSSGGARPTGARQVRAAIQRPPLAALTAFSAPSPSPR